MFLAGRGFLLGLLRRPALPRCFEKNDGPGGGYVQRRDSPGHGNAQQVVAGAPDQIVQPAAFASQPIERLDDLRLSVLVEDVEEHVRAEADVDLTRDRQDPGERRRWS